jgi:hypothetical protein
MYILTQKNLAKLLEIWVWDPESGKNLPGIESRSQKHQITDHGSGYENLVINHEPITMNGQW